MVKRTMFPWLVWAEVAVAIVALVVEVLKKSERGKS